MADLVDPVTIRMERNRASALANLLEWWAENNALETSVEREQLLITAAAVREGLR